MHHFKPALAAQGVVGWTPYPAPRGLKRTHQGLAQSHGGPVRGPFFVHLPWEIRCSPSLVSTIAAQDFLRVADILQPGFYTRRNVTGGWMRRELPQGLKFQII